jgi:hypothetical protein
LVTQSNSTSSTAAKQACKVDSNDVDPEMDRHEGENSQKEMLNCKGMKEKIPKRKCSTVRARHLAQVCRLAMVLTDKIFVVCMYQYSSLW